MWKNALTFLWMVALTGCAAPQPAPPARRDFTGKPHLNRRANPNPPCRPFANAHDHFFAHPPA